MKKVAVFIMAMVLAVSTAVSAAAAGFTPSVSGKDAPDVVVKQDADGNKIVAEIKDANGNVVKGVKPTELIITPVAKADSAQTEIKKSLKKAYDQIQQANTVADFVPEITSFLAKLPGQPKVEEMVVRDLFDVSLNGAAKKMLEDGRSIELTFQLGVKADELVVCLHNFSGNQWEVIAADKVKNNGNGTVTVALNSLSPIAFAVEKTAGSNPDKMNPGMGAGSIADTAAAVALMAVGAVALAVIKQK